MGLFRKRVVESNTPLEGDDRTAMFMIMGYELVNAEERGLTGDEQSEWASSLLWAAVKESGNERLLFKNLGILLSQNEPSPDEDDGQFDGFLRDVGYLDARQRVMRREKKWGN